MVLVKAFVYIAAGSMFNRLKATDNPFGEVDDDDEGEDVMEASQVTFTYLSTHLQGIPKVKEKIYHHLLTNGNI